MPFSWSAVNQAQGEDFAADLARQEAEQSLVFKLIQEQQREDERQRRQEQQQYERQRNKEQDQLEREYKTAAITNQEADNTRQEEALKASVEDRAFDNFTKRIGLLPAGSVVPPSVYEAAKKYGVEGRFEAIGDGTYRVLESATERARRQADEDRNRREARLGAAQEANLAAQTHRLKNEDARLADQQQRTAIIQQRAQALVSAGTKLPPELQALFKKRYDEKIAAAKAQGSFMGFGGSTLSDDETLKIAEETLNEVRSLAGQPAAMPMTPTRSTTSTPTPAGRFKVTVIK